VLIRKGVLDRMVTGVIDLVFRRHKRRSVRTGGTLRTQVGMLDIVSIDPVDVDALTLADARRAGYDSLDGLVTDLTSRPEGEFYRVVVRPGGTDPRVELREDADLTDDDVASISARLDRYDRGGRGPWTRTFLDMLAERPHVRAPDLAESIGWETKPFKEHVRKLKELGLTISHSPGYELSPRGHALRDRLWPGQRGV
jgi:hypothetical protein